MVNDRFLQLLTKELCDQLTENELEELHTYLRESQEHRDQRELLKSYWEKDRGEYEANTAMFKKVIEKIKAEESTAQHEAPLPPEAPPLTPETPTAPKAIPAESIPPETIPRGPRIPARTWYSAAAAILLAISGLWYYHTTSRTATTIAATHWLQQSTHPTKKTILTLADGTVVTLNSSTTIKYPEHFSDSTREVYLQGEAYFDVSKDALHPFIIHADKMNIRVLGTSFNVKSYQSEVSDEATLISGSIEVSLNDRPSVRIILKPKEKLIVQNNQALKQAVTSHPQTIDTTRKTTRFSLTNLTYFPNTVKTVVETSWVENKLVFSEKDFADLSGQLERWYGVHIEFQNDKVKHYNFTGFFEKETLPEALDALKMIEHFNYRIADSVVYIY